MHDLKSSIHILDLFRYIYISV